MKPVIGISTFSENKSALPYCMLKGAYIRAVHAAGGLPVLLPDSFDPEDAEDYSGRLDGIVFTGGGDIAPRFYNQEPSPHVDSIQAARDEAELALFHAVRKHGLAIFGICRGQQLINVAMGGNLIQDIPAEVPGAHGHSQESGHANELFHSVEITDATSVVFDVFKKKAIRVNSTHHQAIKELAPGLKVTAHASDGIIEGIESTEGKGFLYAIQFHPEVLFERYPEFLGLFERLITAAR